MMMRFGSCRSPTWSGVKREELMTFFLVGVRAWARRAAPARSLLQATARCGATNAASCDLAAAPTCVAASSPSLNSISVGMPRLPSAAGVCGFSSTFSLAIRSDERRVGTESVSTFRYRLYAHHLIQQHPPHYFTHKTIQQ